MVYLKMKIDCARLPHILLFSPDKLFRANKQDNRVLKGFGLVLFQVKPVQNYLSHDWKVSVLIPDFRYP